MDLTMPEHPGNDCVLCGRCMEVCPVLRTTRREELGPRAKGLLVRRLKESGNGLSLRKVRALASLCVGCDRCRSVCPQSVDIPAQIMALKSQSREWKDWLVSVLFSTAAISWPVLMRLPGLAAQGNGLEHALSPWIRLELPKRTSTLPRVLLFPGCIARFRKGVWESRARSLLEAMGTTVEEPGFACCGFSMSRNGLFQEFRSALETNLRLWREAGRPPVVTFCTTCWSGLRGYADLEGWEPEERKLWLRSVTDLGTMLEGARGEAVGPVPAGGVIIHLPCHRPAGTSWIEQAISGLAALTRSTECCGFGGTFQLTGRALSRKVAAGMWRTMAPGQGAQVLSDCSGCVLQLKMTHPAEAAAGHWLEVVQPG
jgi:glycolate oxidase iron-sulfur subunit